MKNTKIRTKLFIGFSLAAIITLMVGTIGTMGLFENGKADTYLYEKITLAIGELEIMSSDLEKIRIAYRDIIIKDSVPNNTKTQVEKITNLRKNITNAISKYSNMLKTQEDKQKFNLFNTNWADYNKHVDQIIDLGEQKKNKSSTNKTI